MSKFERIKKSDVVQFNELSPSLIDEMFFSMMRLHLKTNKTKTMKTEKEFAVTSDSYALYEAFKKECEAIGWKYEENIIPFNENSISRFPNFLFLLDWGGSGNPKFSLCSHVSADFNLGSQYSEAIAYAKQVFNDSKKKMFSCEYILEKIRGKFALTVYGDSKQVQKLLAISQMLDVAVYLNPENMEADVEIKILQDGIITSITCTTKTGMPRFTTATIAQKAVRILGEDVIRLALS